MVLDESPVLQVTDTHLVFFSSENRYLRIVIAQLSLFQHNSFTRTYIGEAAVMLHLFIPDGTYFITLFTLALFNPANFGPVIHSTGTSVQMTS